MLGIKFELVTSKETEQCVSVSFVDNVDLTAEGDNAN